MHPAIKVVLWGVSLFALAWAGLAAFQFGRFPFQTGLLILAMGQGGVSFLANPLVREALGWNRVAILAAVFASIAISSAGYMLAQTQARTRVATAARTSVAEEQQPTDGKVHQVTDAAAPQPSPAPKVEAPPTAANPGFTMKERPCGIGPHDLSIERAGRVGDWRYYVKLAIDSRKGFDSLWDRIYLCTGTGAGAPGPYIRLEYWDLNDKPMSIARENFEIPVATIDHLPTTGSSVHTLPRGVITMRFDNAQWIASMGSAMASDQFSCDTNWCHVAIYKDFMDADMIDGNTVKMTVGNGSDIIGSTAQGVDGYARAFDVARSVWRALRKEAGPRHVKIISAAEEAARDKRIKAGLPMNAPEPAAPPPELQDGPASAPVAAAPKPAADAKASFSCASAATPGRKLVCADQSIASLDATVAAMYRRALTVAADPRAIQADQAMFNAKRDACTSRACVQSALVERKRELADWQ